MNHWISGMRLAMWLRSLTQNWSRNCQKKQTICLRLRLQNAGSIILSRAGKQQKEQIENTIEHLNRALEQVQCKRRLNREIMRKDGAELSKENFDKIFKERLCCRKLSEDGAGWEKGFDSLYFMELKISADELKTQVAKMMQDPECGGIFPGEDSMKDDAGSWMRQFNRSWGQYEADRGQAGGCDLWFGSSWRKIAYEYILIRKCKRAHQKRCDPVSMLKTVLFV